MPRPDWEELHPTNEDELLNMDGIKKTTNRMTNSHLQAAQVNKQPPSPWRSRLQSPPRDPLPANNK